MKPRKIQSKSRYVWSFIIATTIFILGFIITNGIAYLEFQRVSGLQGPTSYKIFEEKLQYTLFGKDICSDDTYKDISEELNYQGQIIGDIERKLGKNDEDVIFRKKFYTLIQIEHLEFIKRINEECNKNINIILFFYSNEEDYLKQSERLGDLLGPIYERNKKNLVLYSIDLNLNSSLIRNLKEIHNVSKEPLILLNEDNRFSKIENINQIEDYLIKE